LYGKKMESVSVFEIIIKNIKNYVIILPKVW